MVESSDIRDQDSLEAWLEDQPREVSVWIASRAAARVLPLWWDAVLREDWALETDVTALPVLRNILVSSVAVVGPNEGSMTAFYADVAVAGAAIRYASANDATAYADATDYATDAAAAAAEALAYPDAATTAVAAAADANANAPTTWYAVRTDAGQVTDGAFPDALPLWPDGAGPLAEQWRAIKWQVAKSEGTEDWQFWLDWYDALLKGRPMLGDAARTWEMLEQIALIDPATWDKGPEVVNPAIREIWQLYRLRDEVAALRAEKERLLAGRASPEARSHNRPPELVDAQPELARQVEIVWTGLDEAQQELEQEVPDKRRLQRIAESMLAALTAIAAYCGKVADAAVMSAAKVGGGAVGTAILDQVANNGRLLRFAKELLAYAVGG